MRGDVSLFCLKDKKGRIYLVPRNLKVDSGCGIGGHSVCSICGKDMPQCWEVVCHDCNKTVCYAHASTKGNCWVCRKCE